MRTITPLILPLSTILAGCGVINPCEPFYNGLTAEQQAACDECNDYQGCGAGETGDDPDVVTMLNHYEEVVFVGDQLSELGIEAGSFKALPISVCEAVAGPVPCARSWSDPTGSDFMCVSCDLPLTDLVRFPESGQYWAICAPGDTGTYWHPALMADDLPQNTWAAWLGCEEWPFAGQPFVCPEGQMAMNDGSGTNFPNTFNWTCLCSEGQDDSCQPGAVCESGWVLDGLHPHPTLCVTPDGTPNGIAPEGPMAYGMAEWGDGIVFDGRTATITTAMVVDAVYGAGLWDDGQRFTLLGINDDVADVVVDECDRRALCGFLGIGAGEVIHAPSDTLERLATEAVTIKISSASGSVRTIDIVISEQ